MKNVGRHNGEMQFSTVMAVTILLGVAILIHKFNTLFVFGSN